MFHFFLKLKIYGNKNKNKLYFFSGAAAAAKIYLESLSRVAKQAQQGTCGGTSDIGKAAISFFVPDKIFVAHSLDIFAPLEANGRERDRENDKETVDCYSV